MLSTVAAARAALGPWPRGTRTHTTKAIDTALRPSSQPWYFSPIQFSPVPWKFRGLTAPSTTTMYLVIHNTQRYSTHLREQIVGHAMDGMRKGFLGTDMGRAYVVQ